MYTLPVGAVFKNETHCLKEWLDHYLFHGVEHFYLINDQSTDNYMEILTPYLEKGLVTLYQSAHASYLGRQRHLYNDFILPHFNRKETHWLLMCDLDEFLWSPKAIDLKVVLSEMDHMWQIQVLHTLFGSNGHDAEVPANTLVASYTRRSATTPTETPGLLKYFVNSSYCTVESLNIHYATAPDHDKTKHFMILNNPYFVLNHYCCQSKEFWRSVKCTRGDADNYRVRTMADFDEYDQNVVEDLRLFEQNKGIIKRISV